MSNITNLIFKNKSHYITQNFSSKHKATDYGTHRKKIEQFGIEDGIITWTGKISGGKAVKIKYPRINKEFLHLHLDKIMVKKGQKIDGSTVIGTTGMTGIATGIHLHLAIKDIKTKKYIDPEEYAKDYRSPDKEHIYYIVKKGDNLSKIAKKYNTTWKDIYEKNKEIIGNNPNLIRIGLKLLIK